MLKAVATINGRRTVMLGLSATNVERLRADQPIRIRGGTIGLDFDIVIDGGRGTEEQLLERWRAAFPTLFDGVVVEHSQ